ncbi:hypothetical protein SPMU_33620 [Sphingomonas mucosissima]|uniref:Uncharacterized protein n=1 Tax=Sphingomonas mucosissima TaxID=370959 RepID=A0A245ZDE3_9SPHN|nr:hypothetical protein SPMU_33620 [Sphingomonas mucosissima]
MPALSHPELLSQLGNGSSELTVTVLFATRMILARRLKTFEAGHVDAAFASLGSNKSRVEELQRDPSL